MKTAAPSSLELVKDWKSFPELIKKEDYLSKLDNYNCYVNLIYDPIVNQNLNKVEDESLRNNMD